MKGDRDKQGFTEDVCVQCGKVIHLLKRFNTPEFNQNPKCWDCEWKGYQNEDPIAISPATRVKDESLHTQNVMEVTPAITDAKENNEALKRINEMDEVF